MAIPFLHDVDFNGNEAFNIIIHRSTSTTRPANPVDGQPTFDTELRTFLTYNAATTSWESISDQDAILGISATGPLHATEDGNRNVALTIDGATQTTLGVVKLAGDLTGVAVSPTVNSVGFNSVNYTTATEIHTAVGKSHDQNTDTGTTAASFQLDSGNAGARVKNVSGVVQLRNAADDGFADLRVKDLIVEGSSTVINSNEVNIGDNEILLNSDVTAAAQNSDGGLAIKRLQSDDTTRADARTYFNNTTGRWEVVDGPVEAVTTFELARKKSFTVGDASALSFVLTHNMNTRDVSVAIRDSATPFALVLTDVEMTTVNSITVKFKKAPAAGAYTVTIIG